jgi:AraC family transcriptional regulator of adaptative response/methylated-DNA-[protein]-cysteine methyltransferase
MRVWNCIRTIPYASVASYGEIAAAIGSPKSSRAVAQACAANVAAIVIPCHRVIRGDGGLGGYRWGVARKRALIDRERKHFRSP